MTKFPDVLKIEMNLAKKFMANNGKGYGLLSDKGLLEDESGEVLKSMQKTGAEAVTVEVDEIRSIADDQAGVVLGKDASGSVSRVDIKDELSPEEIEKYLNEFKTRFDSLPQLHVGIEWGEVEKSLRADPESMINLFSFDEKGHALNVFGTENGEFVFVSAWNEYEQVAEDHRNIAFDAEGEKWCDRCNGNAVSIISAIMGVEEEEARNYLADPLFYKQLCAAVVRIDGSAWLKTDAARRKRHLAVIGNPSYIHNNQVDSMCAYMSPDFNRGYISFRIELRVKKI